MPKIAPDATTTSVRGRQMVLISERVEPESSQDVGLCRAIEACADHYPRTSRSLLYRTFACPDGKMRAWALEALSGDLMAPLVMPGDDGTAMTDVVALVGNIRGAPLTADERRRLRRHLTGAKRPRQRGSDLRPVVAGRGKPAQCDPALIFWAIRVVEAGTGRPFGFSRDKDGKPSGPRLRLVVAGLERLFAGILGVFRLPGPTKRSDSAPYWQVRQRAHLAPDTIARVVRLAKDQKIQRALACTSQDASCLANVRGYLRGVLAGGYE